jgi:type I restriction enzyme S subunit
VEQGNVISQLKPYPAIKDSGVPWLGDVPAHWNLRRTKTLLIERVEKGFPDEPLLAATQTKGVVRKDQYENRTVLALKDLHLLKLVRIGDFVISLRSFQGGVEFAREQGIISPAYTVLYPTDSEMHGFLAKLFKSKPYVENLTLYVTGIRQGQNIHYEKLSRSAIPYLPLPEQTAIVRFLDYYDRKIWRHIRAKRKLISLLEEQKQAIIHHAVTRGLDANVRLKPSGVEWLGDVPEHWEVVLNQRILKEEVRPHRGRSETQLSLSQKDGLIATSAMQERSLQTSTYENWKVTIPGDLVLNRFKAHLGAFFSSTLRGIVSFHYGVFAPRRPLVSKYFELLYHTNAYRTIYAGRSNGMTVGLQNLSNQNFYNVRSVVPPVQEQMEIVSFAEKATARLNDAIHAAKREIDLLREYRTRLIADVVTGKLDVREVAARLPQEAEEPEPIDEVDALTDIEEQHDIVEDSEE